MCQFMNRRRGIFLSSLNIIQLIFLLTFNTERGHTKPILLFEDAHFRGQRSEFRIDDLPSASSSDACINIRGKLNDFFSSVEHSAGDCYLLCEHEFCRGRCVEITQSIPDLVAIGFNDAASSIKRCPITSTTQAAPASLPHSSSLSTTAAAASSPEASTASASVAPSSTSTSPSVSYSSSPDVIRLRDASTTKSPVSMPTSIVTSESTSTTTRSS